jgi:hypothetical protein
MDALTHKRGYALHKVGMLEYRAFELTQTKLDVLASQHNPQSLLSKGMGQNRFEAPDLLLPSMQKPQQTPKNNKQHSVTVTTATEDGEDGTTDADDLDGQHDYGEEYDDTRTFTVKDFKEQALRYAKDHFNATTVAPNIHYMNTGVSASEINTSHMAGGKAYNKH